MSARDRDRLKVLHEVGEGHLTQKRVVSAFRKWCYSGGVSLVGGADMRALGMSATDKGARLPARRRHSWAQNHPATSSSDVFATRRVS